jgi:hypothetical protein
MLRRRRLDRFLEKESGIYKAQAGQLANPSAKQKPSKSKQTQPRASKSKENNVK